MRVDYTKHSSDEVKRSATLVNQQLYFGNPVDGSIKESVVF